MKCEICDLIKEKKGLVFEDEDVIALLHPKPAAPGHIILTSKQHVPIIENCPNKIVGKLFNVANKVSTGVFEGLQAHGTNIIIQNGVEAGQTTPHFVINIIPRREKDGLNFQWEPRKVKDEDLESAELQLKEKTENIGIEKEAPKAVEVKKEKPAEIEGEDNYLIKQLERIP
ncbi:HIT family protein [Nanoarchaeota archaeon]